MEQPDHTLFLVGGSGLLVAGGAPGRAVTVRLHTVQVERVTATDRGAAGGVSEEA
jgi:hypothetical protein